ncbi:MAG: autotransporter outer membrane beta-barrel domain-containing protein [Planctomycetaceae bacterium]|nr:autotransporter outer membrane beta-barrel domain-containing protein [Planctomycetaceae bacterium]
MRKHALAAFVAAFVLCATASAGQYYSNARYTPATHGNSSYNTYAAQPDMYEYVPVHQVFASIMHRNVRLKKETDTFPRAKYTPTSFSVGYVHTANQLQFGGAFNFEAGTRKLNGPGNQGMEIRTNVPGVSGFATLRPFNDSTYVSASAFLGFAQFKGKDAFWNGRINGTDKENRTLFSLGFEAGRTWGLGYGLLLTPHVGFDYTYAPSERYHFDNVGGVGPAQVSIGSQSFYEFPIGVALRKTFDVGGWLITPKVDFTIVPSVGRVDPKNAHPGFAYRVADKWKVVGAAGDNFGARINLGVDAKLGQRIAVGVEYTYEGRSRYDDHRIAANFNLAF